MTSWRRVGSGQEQVRCMGRGAESARRPRGGQDRAGGFAVLSALAGRGTGAAGREVRSWALAPGGLLRFFPGLPSPAALVPPCSVSIEPRGRSPRAQTPDGQKWSASSRSSTLGRTPRPPPGEPGETPGPWTWGPVHLTGEQKPAHCWRKEGAASLLGAPRVVKHAALERLLALAIVRRGEARRVRGLRASSPPRAPAVSAGDWVQPSATPGPPSIFASGSGGGGVLNLI